MDSAYYLSDASLIAGDASIVLPDGSSGAGVNDNGYVRITVLEILPPVGTPGNLHTVSVSPDSITIAWDEAENAAGYTVSRNGAQLADQTAVTYTDTGLSHLTSYTYSVMAYDGDGNESDAVSITVTTTYPPPGAPTGLRLYGGTQTALILLWDSSDEQVEYVLSRNGTEVYRGEKLSYTDHSLSSGTTYVYQLSTATEWGETPGPSVEGTTASGIALITDRTEADVSSGRAKGRYNALDLIRVGEAMLYVQSLLADFGYSVPLKVKLDWQITDIPTYALMRRYIDDVQALRDVVPLLDTTPPVPESANDLDYTGANNIEQILSDIDYVVHHIFETMFRAGQFDAWSGHRPFPTANSNPGRTWGELDVMQTTWANWQAATWYLLLYGNLRAEGEVS